VKKVAYESKKLLAIPDDRNPEAIPDELRERLYVTKFDHWKYEQEFRVMVRLADAKREGKLNLAGLSRQKSSILEGPTKPEGANTNSEYYVRVAARAVVLSRDARVPMAKTTR
jgi:hypothetical protein